MPTSTPAERSLRQLIDCGERPFPSLPRVDRYFPAAAIEDARRRLGRAIERGDGPGLVIGAAGMGKTLLMQALAAQFHPRFDVVLLGCARLCTRRALLQAILFELDLPHRLRDEGRLRLALLDHLLESRQAPTGLLLLVDEAQTLPVTLLDELRVMTNLVDRGVPMVRLVLAGSPVLEETFASPELESLSQRLGARSYLSPFSREETAQYIRAQLHASGAAVDEVLRPEAWEAVFEATDGVPRLVNQLCDRAILVATAENCLRLDRRVVQDAWADLQQLPSPWQSSPAVGAGNASSVVEFGALVETEKVAVAAMEFSPAGIVAESEVYESDSESLEPSADDDISIAFEEEVAIGDSRTLVDSSVVAEDSSARKSLAPCKRDPANPFDEAFDEEEVVIDSFAALQNLFASTTPRVENRRDPAFASLARLALDAAGGDAKVEPQPPVVVEEELPNADDAPEVAAEATDLQPVERAVSGSPYDAFPIVNDWDTLHTADIRVPDPDDFIDELDPRWPPLRLANLDSADAAERAATASFHDESEDDELELVTSNVRNESPILIVEEVEEDDGGPRGPSSDRPRSGARRQEYGRLFSRLRSG